MKTLITRHGTGEFLALDGGWTSEISEACDYPDLDDAIRVLMQMQPWDAALYFSFGDGSPSPLDFVVDPLSCATDAGTAPSPEAAEPAREI